ncbi:MAG: hypothetical protein Q7J68_07200, partial [Thermoplasmata archaeon]|nr:hypothetical protein [Thermoplasmata archaeon]
FAMLATPVTAAAPQTCVTFMDDEAGGSMAKYTNVAGDEGWTMYWTDHSQNVFSGNPAQSSVYDWYAGLPDYTEADFIMDNLYTDAVDGWLLSSQVTIIYENATGYVGWTYCANTGTASPKEFNEPACKLYPISTASISGSDIALTWPAIAMGAFSYTPDASTTLADVNAQLMGYEVYRSTTNATWNDNAAMGTVSGAITDWTLVGGSAGAPITGTSWTDTGILTGSGSTYYYSTKLVFRGLTSAAVYDNQTTMYGGQGSNGINDPMGTSFPPETTLLTAWNPVGLAGDTTSEWVTLNATIDEPDGTDTLLAAEFRVDGGAAQPMAAVDGTFDGITETVTGTYNFPDGPFAEGAHTFEVRGQDNVDGWNTTWVSSTFTITDTTSPLGAYLAGTPANGADRQAGATVDVTARYTDFTNFSVATLFYWNQSEVARANNVTMTDYAWDWGSYIVDFTGSFAVWGSAGDVITYEVEFEDLGNAGANPPTVIAQRTIDVIAAATTATGPVPIYGTALQYDGTLAGGYLPVPIPGAVGTVVWYNNTISAWTTSGFTADGDGDYIVDIYNVTDGGTVYVNVTNNPVYGNLGWNYTILAAGVGGEYDPVRQNVTCGIPYDIRILQPVANAIIQITALFTLEYEIIDRLLVRTPGYYTFADGLFNMSAWPSPMAPNSYVAPPDTQFDGIGGGDGVYLGVNVMQINYPTGQWWLNESEGGQVEPIPNPYLTPWGQIFLDPALSIPLWYKDWHNISINVTGGGFDWYLTQGWNLVSCPQNATFDINANAYFDAQDAMNWTNTYLFNNWAVYDGALAMADRTGPGAYITYLLDTGLGFAIDSTSGYWVWLGLAGPYVIHFDAVNATTTGMNVTDVAVAAGWNMLGYQHNFTITWGFFPWASDFTDGTIAAFLTHTSFGGLRTKLSVTQWTTAKWYNSYVVDVGFNGVVAKDWQWISSYSTQPGNGFWLWSDAGGTMTYSTVL